MAYVEKPFMDLAERYASLGAHDVAKQLMERAADEAEKAAKQYEGQREYETEELTRASTKLAELVQVHMQDRLVELIGKAEKLTDKAQIGLGITSEASLSKFVQALGVSLNDILGVYSETRKDWDYKQFLTQFVGITLVVRKDGLFLLFHRDPEMPVPTQPYYPINPRPGTLALVEVSGNLAALAAKGGQRKR